MKILHIAPDRDAALVPARVVHGIAQNVAPTWLPTPAAALEWLHHNRDTAAVIVEVQAESGASFIEQLRGLGLTTPVVVVAGPARLEPGLAALKSGADGYMVAGPSLDIQLPRIVAAAIENERSRRQFVTRILTGLGVGGERAGQPPARVEAASRQLQPGSTEPPAAAARLADAEARHAVSLARETRICIALQQRLFELESELRKAEERRASQAVSSAGQLAKRHAEFTASLTQAAQSRDALVADLSVATAALEEARQTRRTEAAAAADQLRQREAELRADLAEAVAAKTAFATALADAEIAHHATRQRAAIDLAAANERQAALEDQLAAETDKRTSLERDLTASRDARHDADQRHAGELARAASEFAELHSRYDTAQESNAAACAALERRTVEAASALERANRERAAEAAAAAEKLAGMEAALGARLAEASAARSVLERGLTEAQSAHQHAMQRAAEDLASAAAHQAALQDRLAQETDRGANLERQLAAVRTAQQDTERRHASDLATAGARLESLQTTLDTAVAEHAAVHAAMKQRLTDAVVAHQQAEDRSAAALAAAATREAALEQRLAREMERASDFERQLSAATTAQRDTDARHTADLASAGARLASLQAEYDTAVTEHAAAHAALEQRLTDTAAAYQQVQDRSGAALAAAAAREAALEQRLLQAADHSAVALAAAAAREAELVARLTRESDARAALERDLTAARMESVRGRGRLLYALSTYRRRARDQKARFVAQLTAERSHAGRELHAKDEEVRRIQLDHESERQQAAAEYGRIRESFDRLQSAFQTLEQIAGDHAAERTRLETVVADRDSQLIAQAERHQAAEQNGHDALAQLEERLRRERDASGSEIAQLQQEMAALRRELDASRTHAEALRGVAERVPDLQTQLERIQNEKRRQFERAPYALCRCSQSGAIIDANHSFVTLLGCRRADELRNADFVAAAQDSAGDLGWLLERTRTTRKTETVEIQWKTPEGRRLVVRLQALATATGSIEIVAEDITDVRSLEQRLRQAQRMEAVGRLASEVAVTCDAMLSDVIRGADEWLARVGGDDVLRRHAERLLTDVSRAASTLRQLGTYGNEQTRALEPVSAQRVLRDFAPVLKRLVGEQIDLVVPKSSGAFNVDVEAERLKRILINVAGYARERMPSGGQVRIDLATTAVGRRFVARYSNVRPGEHVLITVTELPAVGKFCGDAARRSRSSDRPGVDLGVLVDLVASCGGHLWLEAQPAGNMVVKIHLPKPPAASAPDNRGGRLSRWLRSTPAADGAPGGRLAAKRQA